MRPCISCAKQNAKAYNERNREIVLNRKRNYSGLHRVEKRAYDKLYRASGRKKENDKKYYLKDGREKHYNYWKKRYAKGAPKHYLVNERARKNRSELPNFIVKSQIVRIHPAHIIPQELVELKRIELLQKRIRKNDNPNDKQKLIECLDLFINKKKEEDHARKTNQTDL